MKKWLLLIVVVALISSVYVFIPSNLTIAKAIIGDCNVSAAKRCFLDSNKWIAWWPGKTDRSKNNSSRNTSFTLNDLTYTITGIMYSTVQVNVQYNGHSIVNGKMHIVAISQDSALIDWRCSLPTGNNPVGKLLAYRQAKKIKNNADTILSALQSFLKENKNIYGVDFHQTMSRDFALVTMTTITSNYPGTDVVYRLIDSIKHYIASQGARAINYPMLNISKTTDSRFKAMVAISVNKPLPGTKNILIKRFVPWKMIEGEVRGGSYTIDEGFEQLHNYKEDHNHTIMAIPFQSLITDRSKQQDTSKWVTKICAPIS